MLNLRCLAIVFDLDEKLIMANTMKSFEDRIEALKGWLLRGSHSSPTSSSPASTMLAFQGIFSRKGFRFRLMEPMVFSDLDPMSVSHLNFQFCDIFKYFTSYKVRVPITGAIILDETYERVMEETGFDVSKLLNKDE
ncbi:hypothetical protein JHK87_009900 [Glycine soja]|nr:hypothetical protein JHK87_009900 [Glycine soja]